MQLCLSSASRVGEGVWTRGGGWGEQAGGGDRGGPGLRLLLKQGLLPGEKHRDAGHEVGGEERKRGGCGAG